mmetsp:Transcript_15613/g.37211  ORF Transcript_15613/g.37211 Transcript_15613/m.37211 type:complete len:221 (-) Transcript_15613:482-1144(-)
MYKFVDRCPTYLHRACLHPPSCLSARSFFLFLQARASSGQPDSFTLGVTRRLHGDDIIMFVGVDANRLERSHDVSRVICLFHESSRPTRSKNGATEPLVSALREKVSGATLFGSKFSMRLLMLATSSASTPYAIEISASEPLHCLLFVPEISSHSKGGGLRLRPTVAAGSTVSTAAASTALFPDATRVLSSSSSSCIDCKRCLSSSAFSPSGPCFDSCLT